MANQNQQPKQEKDHSKEDVFTQLSHGDIDSIDTNARYLAYGARLRTALAASSRYLAYTSDVGEAFRPVVSPLLVKATYGISWAYLGLDVGYECYKAVQAGKDNTIVATTAVKRGVFQALASMAFPMFTIHTVVKYSAKAFKDVKSTAIRAWGPTSIGLSIIPFLPYLFDHPVEQLVDYVFEPLEERIAGDSSSFPKVAHETIESEKAR
ncbi:mitochondrial 18 KDa protein-domain-containing protein [Spinellus fusiger]|nr:mitochondrial 18 KDa protein-domain-containing protein [Spinellus fusiger]